MFFRNINFDSCVNYYYHHHHFNEGKEKEGKGKKTKFRFIFLMPRLEFENLRGKSHICTFCNFVLRSKHNLFNYLYKNKLRKEWSIYNSNSRNYYAVSQSELLSVSLIDWFIDLSDDDDNNNNKRWYMGFSWAVIDEMIMVTVRKILFYTFGHFFFKQKWRFMRECVYIHVYL